MVINHILQLGRTTDLKKELDLQRPQSRYLGHPTKGFWNESSGRMQGARSRGIVDY